MKVKREEIKKKVKVKNQTKEKSVMKWKNEYKEKKIKIMKC